jgi:hypothetical protein
MMQGVSVSCRSPAPLGVAACWAGEVGGTGSLREAGSREGDEFAARGGLFGRRLRLCARRPEQGVCFSAHIRRGGGPGNRAPVGQHLHLPRESRLPQKVLHSTHHLP